jgi:hypothetical protein
MSTLPERWVTLYTLGLPDETRRARRDEIASDVFEQQAEFGASARGLRLSIAGRALRGAPGDVMWRFEEGRAMSQQRQTVSGRPTGVRAVWATVTQSWFTPIAVLVGVFDVFMALYVILDEGGKMPGQVIGPILLCSFAVAMFTGLWLRWRAQFDGESKRAPRERGARRDAIVVRVLALVAVVLLAVGLVGSIVAMVAGVVALAVVVLLFARRRRPVAVVTTNEPRSAGSQSLVLADVLIVFATLPALSLFWMVFPTLLAIVVIGGVIGTGPGLRRAAAV